MPGPPPEHPHLRLLKGNPGKRPARSPPEPTRTEQCPKPPEHLTGLAREAWIHLAPEPHKLNLLTILDIGSALTAALMPTGNKPKRRCAAPAS
jgi:phage terminase small subunit